MLKSRLWLINELKSRFFGQNMGFLDSVQFFSWALKTLVFHATFPTRREFVSLLLYSLFASCTIVHAYPHTLAKVGNWQNVRSVITSGDFDSMCHRRRYDKNVVSQCLKNDKKVSFSSKIGQVKRESPGNKSVAITQPSQLWKLQSHSNTLMSNEWTKVD